MHNSDPGRSPALLSFIPGATQIVTLNEKACSHAMLWDVNPTLLPDTTYISLHCLHRGKHESIVRALAKHRRYCHLSQAQHPVRHPRRYLRNATITSIAHESQAVQLSGLMFPKSPFASTGGRMDRLRIC